MSILSWDKPEKIMTTEQWAALSFDDGPPGAYVPNMSTEDRLRWKAKYIGGKYARVEIRKTATNFTQMLIIVTLTGTPLEWCGWSKKDKGQAVNAKISMNGTSCFTFEEVEQLQFAIAEAQAVLEEKAT